MLKDSTKAGSDATRERWITSIIRQPYRFVILVLLLINISLVVVNIGFWIISARQNLFVQADFTAFYTGFYLVRVGEGTHLYDPALQSNYQQQFMGGLTFEGGVLLFANPPFVAILFSPISLLPLNVAFYIWTLLQLALLIWFLFSINRLFSHWDKLERIFLVVTILAFWPLAYNFLLGQYSLLLLTGLLQVYISMKNNKLTHAGLWLSVLLIKPHTLLIPAMMTLNRRYWRVAVTTAITGISVFIVSWLIIGLQPWLQYIQSLKALSSFFDQLGVNPNTEYTIRGILSHILGSSQGNLTNIISGIVLVIGMCYVWFIWKKGVSQDGLRYQLYFALTILLSVFLSMHLNPHDSLMLVLPAALFYDYLRQSGYPKKAITILILISPLIFFIATFNQFNLFGVIRPPVVLIILLVAWMIRYLILDTTGQKIQGVSMTP